jgi:hypothetical protein
MLEIDICALYIQQYKTANLFLSFMSFRSVTRLSFNEKPLLINPEEVFYKDNPKTFKGRNLCNATI